ncbi:MAG: putative GNAT family N-acyltransferase [Bacteroidia bacterium]|jgi:predicted GNAT family N-acyltransferase
MTAIQVGLIEYDSEQYMESVNLRQDVLRTPLGLKFTKENMVTDVDEIHIAATDGQSIIGILLLRPINKEIVKMRQVAVLSASQGQGIGKKLVAFSENFAQHMGFTEMELHARKVSLPFYSSQNYQIVGDEFLEIGIPHFKMIKKL